MEPGADADELFCSMEDNSVLTQTKTPNIAPEKDNRTISVQVLEFKTSFLELVKELHIGRDVETRHEEQICKLVLEKQELEWQKESLQSQISRMSHENSESLAAMKKQFQAQIRRTEGEKGKMQLAAELKDKEITSLKEELKLLQLLKYSLEKQSVELGQKLQLQTQLKDSHLSQLGEAERRFAAVSRQCAGIRQAHEKLEQNVEEAMRMNKKLTSINGTQELTIKALREDAARLHKELVTLKVSSACEPGEECLQNVMKDQQLLQLQQKLLVETEMNKKLRNEAVTERAEKQELLKSLHHTQQLLQIQTEALIRTEQELHTLRVEHQVYKTEHELSQERNREKQVHFERLRDEYENSKLAWEKKMTDLHDQKSRTPENYLGGTVSEVNLVKVSSLQRDVSVEPEENMIGQHNNREPMRRPVKGGPDERAADGQRIGTDENGAAKVSTQVDGTITEVSPIAGPDILVWRPEEVSAKTDQLSHLCAETKTIICEGETACNAADKGCPSNRAQCDADSGLTEPSGPETRSAYEVDGDPLTLEHKDGTLEQNLCILEATEPQTSDKHIDSHTESRRIKDQLDTPEFLPGLPQTEDQASTERLSEDEHANSSLQKTADRTHATEDMIPDRPCEETTQQELQPSLDSVFPGATTSFETHRQESVSATAAGDSLEVISQNKDQNHADPTFALCPHTLTAPVSSEEVNLHPNITNPSQDPSFPDGYQSDVDHTCMTVVGASDRAGNKRYRPAFAWDTFINEQKNVQTKRAAGNVDPSVIIRNRKSSMTLPPSTPSESQRRSCGFLSLELGSSFSPLLTQDKRTKQAVIKTPDRFQTPNNRPRHTSDGSDGWNEIKQSFSGMFVERENRVVISYSSTVSVRPASSSAGNESFVPPLKPQSLQTDTWPAEEGTEEPNRSDTGTQIAKMEQYMSWDGLTPPNTRKID